MILTVKGFGIVDEGKVDFFLDSLALSMIQRMLATGSLISLPYVSLAWILTSGS